MNLALNIKRDIIGESLIVFTGAEDTADEEEDDNGEEEEDEELKPLNEMADGETIDVKGGAYRIKRTGDHYYCT